MNPPGSPVAHGGNPQDPSGSPVPHRDGNRQDGDWSHRAGSPLTMNHEPLTTKNSAQPSVFP